MEEQPTIQNRTGIVQLTPGQALDNWARMMYYETAEYNKWKTQCLSNRKFYYGDQLSAADAAKMAERGQFQMVVNKIRKSIRGLTGLLASSLPKYRVVSSFGDDAFDSYITDLSNRILDWAWQNSNGIHLFQRGIKRAAVDNISYLNVIYSMDKKIKMELLSYDDVMVDPSSKDPMFADAESIVIIKRISLEKAKTVYGIGQSIVMDSQAILNFASQSGTTEQVRIFLNKVYDVSKSYVLIYECYKKLSVKTDEGEWTTQIMKETLVGFQHAYREFLPKDIHDYPIIPIYAEDTENPYKLGEVMFLKDLQQFINKCFGVVILNAQTLSNPKIVLKETDIPDGDVATFMNTYANPGSVSVLSQNAGEITVIPGQPLNNAFFQLYLEASGQLEQATIPNQVMGYNDSKKQQTPSDFLDIRESVIDAYKDFQSNIELSATQCGKVILQFAKAYLSGPQVIKVFGNKNDLHRLELNRQINLDLSDDLAVQKYKMWKMQQGTRPDVVEKEINDAKKDEAIAKALVYFDNSTDFVGYDVFVITGSTTQTYQSAMLRIMMELWRSQLVDATEVLKYAPVENKEELLYKYDTMRLLQSELESKQQMIDELQKTVDSLGGETEKSAKTAQMLEHKYKLYKIENDQRVKAYLNKHMSKIMSQREIEKFAQDLAKVLSDTEKQLTSLVNDVKVGEVSPEVALTGLQTLSDRI